MKIFGAGIAGLLAGCAFQDAEIYEAKEKEDYTGHKALLRFRSTAVADMTGIEFSKVKVHKGIWYNDGFNEPDIRLSNMYSKKVIGSLADRSIWNTESVDRWVAPHNLVEQLIDICKNRIVWGYKADQTDAFPNPAKIINTLPLPVILNILKRVWKTNNMEFKRNAIAVKRFSIPGCGVNQTIYYPDPDIQLYRASIAGDILIAEYIMPEKETTIARYEMLRSFGLTSDDIYPEEVFYKYNYGKIKEIDDSWRKSCLLDLSQKHNIFSLGRFATWRNILADDLPHDISVIKRLMNESQYDNLVRK